ncbi:MAG: hypothetical protein GXO86_10110 [Chlorobi bacterium]|nr:hypothetical protein [Chlorobiota bacterium]
MKKTARLLMILFFMALITGMQAQYQNTSGQKREGDVKKKELKKKKKKDYYPWFVGGMFGAGFSSISAYVQISPIIGYKITPAFHVGTRLTYIFNSFEVAPNQRENFHDYGASIFARYVFFKGLFGQVEYEALSYQYWDKSGRDWINSLFIGGGYYMNMGGRGFASIALMFNVLDNEYSPYTNPIIRIGFGVGF